MVNSRDFSLTVQCLELDLTPRGGFLFDRSWCGAAHLANCLSRCETKRHETWWILYQRWPEHLGLVNLLFLFPDDPTYIDYMYCIYRWYVYMYIGIVHIRIHTHPIWSSKYDPMHPNVLAQKTLQIAQPPHIANPDPSSVAQRFFIDRNQLMVNCWFGVRWFGILGAHPRIPIPFIFGDSFRNPNHRDPNQQLTIGWRNECLLCSIVWTILSKTYDDCSYS